MNTTINIDYLDGNFIVTVIEYDPIPFGNNKDEVIEEFTANDEIELHSILLNEGYYDKLKDNA